MSSVEVTLETLKVWCCSSLSDYNDIFSIDGKSNEDGFNVLNHGLAFVSLIHAHRADLIPHPKTLQPWQHARNHHLAFTVAEEQLGVPRLLDPRQVEYDFKERTKTNGGDNNDDNNTKAVEESDHSESNSDRRSTEMGRGASLFFDRLALLAYLSQLYHALQTNPQVKEGADGQQPSISISTLRRNSSKEDGDTCCICNRHVFLLERLVINNQLLHRTCFRCARCNAQLAVAGYYETEGGQFCCEICPDEEKKETNKVVEGNQRRVIDQNGGHEDESNSESSTSDSDNECDHSLNEEDEDIVPNLDEMKVGTALESIVTKDIQEDQIYINAKIEPEIGKDDKMEIKGDESKTVFEHSTEIGLLEGSNTTKDGGNYMESEIQVEETSFDTENKEDRGLDINRVSKKDEYPVETEESIQGEKLAILEKEMYENSRSNEQGQEVVSDVGNDVEDNQELKEDGIAQHLNSEEENQQSVDGINYDRAEDEKNTKLPDERTCYDDGDDVIKLQGDCEDFSSSRGGNDEEPSITPIRKDCDAHVKAQKKGTELYPDDLNPFGSDDDEVTSTEKPKSTNPFGSSDEDEDAQSTSNQAKSDTSVGLAPPKPPRVSLNPFESDESDDERTPNSTPTTTLATPSPASSMRSRKKRQAPLPPTPTRRPPPPPVNTPATPKAAMTSSSSFAPDKSQVEGQWKRKKGPAPPRPVPPRRVLKVVDTRSLNVQLHDIEVKQNELERQGVALEQKIRALEKEDEVTNAIGKDEGDELNSPSNIIYSKTLIPELTSQLFDLIQEKTELGRRQTRLLYLKKDQRLEEQHADLEHKIRLLMVIPESKKTEEERRDEDELIQQLMEVVSQRNQIVEMLELERIRNKVDEDHVQNARHDHEEHNSSIDEAKIRHALSHSTTLVRGLLEKGGTLKILQKKRKNKDKKLKKNKRKTKDKNGCEKQGNLKDDNGNKIGLKSDISASSVVSLTEESKKSKSTPEKAKKLKKKIFASFASTSPKKQ